MKICSACFERCDNLSGLDFSFQRGKCDKCWKTGKTSSKNAKRFVVAIAKNSLLSDNYKGLKFYVDKERENLIALGVLTKRGKIKSRKN